MALPDGKRSVAKNLNHEGRNQSEHSHLPQGYLAINIHVIFIITLSNTPTYFFFCFVDVGATLREAWTSLGGTGILTEFTLEDGESNGIPRELLAGRPFNPPGVVDKVPNELPIDKKVTYKWMKRRSF